MDIIFFVPMGVILIFLLVFVGGIFEIIRSFTQILFVSSVFFFLFLGIRIIIKGVSYAIREKKTLWFITETIRGVFTSVISFYIFLLLSIGAGHFDLELFDKVKYVLFGTFNKLDFFLACFLISTAVIIIVAIPVQLADKEILTKKSIILQLISIFCVFSIFVGFWKIGMKSEFINSKDDFKWDIPEYKTTQTIPLKQDCSIFMLKTGFIKAGTSLYASNRYNTYRDKKYVEVSDGSRMGYVAEDDVQLIVDYTYFVKSDTNIYGYEEEQMSRGDLSVTFVTHTEDVISTVTKGTELEVQHRKDADFVFVKLPDGTLGFIDKKYIQEVRVSK